MLKNILRIAWIPFSRKLIHTGKHIASMMDRKIIQHPFLMTMQRRMRESESFIHPMQERQVQETLL
ncbi:MAG: hypothetical protein BHV64_12230 [Alistipes sp. 56_sp_Nov_56_25]|nr:MAG: hypothetical protein BHV64_12230 [Alistipes sp. 56_sp_Nov_56_25]